MGGHMAQQDHLYPAAGVTDDLLQSWKEIAVFLGKGVRTVQRWEAKEGLPVRRHRHQKGCTIYAFKSELREWYTRRQPDLIQRQHQALHATWSRSRLVAASLAGIAALALTAGIARLRGRPAQRVLTPISFLTVPGRASQPALSPDGTRVVYCWNGERGGAAHLDLYLTNTLTNTGNAPRRLTSHPSNDHSPAWSPDGKQIAFLRNNEGVFVVAADGSNERRLLGIPIGAEFAIGMSWSPNGRFLVFSMRRSPQQPFRLNLLPVEGGHPQELTSPPLDAVGDMYPAYSPDGQQLAFVRETPGPADDVYLMRVGEGASAEQLRLTFDSRAVFGLAWLPNGRDIVFSSDRSGVRRLWVLTVPPKGAARLPRPLAFAGEDAFQPATSRNGNRLVYCRRHWTSSIWRAEVSLGGRSAFGVARVIPPVKENYHPQYSPDGRLIAFVSTRTGTTEIWIADREGRGARRLTYFGRPGTLNPRWSPDGNEIAFQAVAEGHCSVYAISSRGGAPRRVTPGNMACFAPSWSRDGKWIYFTSDFSGRPEVWKAPSEGGPVVQVTGGGGENPVESSDGRWIIYRKDGGLFRMPVTGGPELRVVADPVGNFDVSGQLVWFDRGFGDFARAALYYADLEAGQIGLFSKLTQPKLSGLSISPDGRWILYPLREPEYSELLVFDHLQ